jgi:DinB superfamily
MTERGSQLHATADGQIAELIALLSIPDEAMLRQPLPGREKLGDATVGASVRHTADNYQRIAAFVRALGQEPADHPGPGPSHSHSHREQYTADTVNLDALVKQLSASRVGLDAIAELTDSQLDAIPPKGSFRFCDGERTLEQVLAGLLKHQHHQVDTLSRCCGPEEALSE